MDENQQKRLDELNRYVNIVTGGGTVESVLNESGGGIHIIQTSGDVNSRNALESGPSSTQSSWYNNYQDFTTDSPAVVNIAGRSTPLTTVGGSQALNYKYDPISGQLTFQAPKAIADTPQWQNFVNNANTALRSKPLQQAINYLDGDDFSKAYSDAITNATTDIMQRTTLANSVGQEVTQQDVDYFGAASTLSDGEGKVRNGAYMYVPVTQPDGTVVYQSMPASEAMKVKNIANVVPGFIRNTKEYIDSTAGEYAATGAGVGNVVGQVVGGIAGGVVAATGSGAIGTAAGVKLGQSIGGNVGSTLGTGVGYLLGDDEGHMESRFQEVLDLVNQKGDTNIMDLTQDEKAEIYAMVVEANSRLQSWADKGIELSDEMRQYYANMSGLQYSLEALGFNKMAEDTTTKNYIENFARQTFNGLSGGGSTLLSLGGGAFSALGGDGFGKGYSEVSTLLATTGLDTYSSPAEQLFAPRSKEGVIGDRGFAGIAVDFVLGLALDPAGRVGKAVDTLVAGGNISKTVGRSLKVIPSIVDDGGLSLLTAGIGAANRSIRRLASNRAAQAAARQTANAAGAAGNAVAKDIARQVANAAEAQVDDGLEVAVNKVANAVSDAGSDEVKQTIRNVANASAEAGEEGLEEAAEQAGKRLSLDDLKRVGGEMLTNGRQITAGVANVLGQAVNAAVDNIAKVVTAAYDGLSRLGGTDRLKQLLDGFGIDTSDMSTEQIKQAYRNAVARGMVRNAIFQVAKQMPMNAVIALGNTAIEQATSQAQGQKFDRQDFWNSLLSNFGTTMLMSATPAGLRAGSSVLDALTNGGVAKIRNKANQFATKIPAAAGTFLRQAPVVKNIRAKMQQFADPDARQLAELRYQNNRARSKGLISYETWINNYNLFSEAQMSTQTMRTLGELDAKSLFDADTRVMDTLGGLKANGRPRRGEPYDRARQLLDDFINYDNMANRIGPETKATRDLSAAAKKKRQDNAKEYIARRNETLEEMDQIVKDNGGDVEEFHRSLFGSKLDTDVDTTQGPVRADVNDNSYRGQLRKFYDRRAQMIADEGLSDQAVLDALRTNPAYAGVYIRFAYSRGASVEEIAENVAQFYTVTNKPKTKSIIQTVENELGIVEGKTPAGPTETAAMSVADVSDAIVANQRNRAAVELSRALEDANGDADLSFCRLVSDPTVVAEGEASLGEYSDFRTRASDTFRKTIEVTEYETTGEEGGVRTDRDTNNLNEFHTRLTNDPYIQKRAQETGIPPEALARSYMADNVSSMVGTYRKQEMHRYGDKKAKQLAGAYRKKVNSWLSGEDLTQADLHTRRQANVEMNDTRQRLRNVSDEVLRADIANKSTSPVDKMLAQQELARRQSTSYKEPQLSDEWSGTSQELIDDSAKAVYSAENATAMPTESALSDRMQRMGSKADYLLTTEGFDDDYVAYNQTHGVSPDQPVKLYKIRGGELKDGDGLFTDKQDAISYSGGNPKNVQEVSVRAGDIMARADGDDRFSIDGDGGEVFSYYKDADKEAVVETFSDSNALPEGYRNWRDTFVRENGTEPTVDDISQQMLMEAQGKRKVQLTTASLRSTYRDVLTRENNSGVVTDEYLAEHKRKLHLGKQVDDAKAKQAMSFIPKNGIELAENKTSAPTLPQVKSAAIYTGQTGKGALSSDVVQALERRGVKQTAASQAKAINSIAADDAIVDTDGSFYSELNKKNQDIYLSNLKRRAKSAVESVGGKLDVPEGMAGKELAGHLGAQLQRARLMQEISNNPERYRKGEFSLARDDDGNVIPGSGKFLTSPERLVVRSLPTSKLDGFNKFSQGVYKTQDQRNSRFNATDDVWLGSAQVLASDDRAALQKIVSSMKRHFSDPLMRSQIDLFAERIENLDANSLDDLPLVQELLNSVYGVDAVRFSKQSGDEVVLFSNTKSADGGVWDTQGKFGDLTAEDIHDFDTTADLWKENVKSKQSDTKARIAQEKAEVAKAQKKPNFAVYDGGKRYLYEITNPTVAQTFQTVSLSTSRTSAQVVAKMFQRSSRAFRNFTTGAWNPAYMLTNYVRDLQTSTVTAGLDTIMPRFADDIYGSIFEAAGIPAAQADEITQRLRQGYGNSTYNMSTQNILNHSPAQQRKILYREMRKQTGTGKSAKRVMSFDQLNKVLEAPNERIEQNRRGRIAESYYNRYIVEHLPDYLTNPSDSARNTLINDAINYATFTARNATTDFSYRSQYASQFLSFIPYARTALSSGRSFGRMFLSDPVGMIYRIAAYGIAPYAANLICNLSDDEKAATYSDIPEWERASNWIVVTGDGTYISAPIPQELEVFLSPMRSLLESANDIKNSGAINTLAGGLCNYSPIDFSGFFERDINGDIDWVKSVSRVANSMLPQAVSPIVESVLNRDLYTGSPLHPTTEDLVRQGAKLNSDGTVDPASLTFASRNSQTLGEIANATGLAQGDVYNLVTGYTGTFGRYLINAVDRLRGAPSSATGGQAVTDYASQAFFNTTTTASESAWNSGLSDLYDRKDNLMEIMDSQDYSDNEKDEYIRDYVDSVKRFCDAYSEYYAIAGGMSDRQRNQVVGLLNFYKGTGSLNTSTEALTQASYDEYNAALQRAVDLGVIPGQGLQSDLYGEMNDEGEVTYTTPSMRAFQNRVYGTPEEATYELEQVLDSDEGGGTMKELKSAVYEALDPYYERIAAGEQLTDDEYDEMDAIRKAYMEEFYRRVDPIVNRYGATILNNDDIIEALNDYTITTSDDWQQSVPQTSKKGKEYYRYISSKLFPNATADVQQILLEHYGMGGRDTTNLRTSERATELIDTLRQATAAGEMGKAQDYQRILFTGIQNGSFYVSDRDMSQLNI